MPRPYVPKHRCTAKAASTQEQCRQAATAGTNVCVAHGARAPQVKAAAARRVAEAKARQEIEKAAKAVGALPHVDPVTALEDNLAQVVALRDRLSQVTAKLSDDAIRYPARTGEQLRGEITAYLAILRDCTKTAEAMLRLDIASQRARIDNAMATVIVGVLRTAVGQVDLPDDKQRELERAIGQALRALDR